MVARQETEISSLLSMCSLCDPGCTGQPFCKIALPCEVVRIKQDDGCKVCSTMPGKWLECSNCWLLVAIFHVGDGT